MMEIFGWEIPFGWMLGWTLESAPPGRVLCVPCMRSTRMFGWLAGVQLLFCKGWQLLCGSGAGAGAGPVGIFGKFESIKKK